MPLNGFNPYPNYWYPTYTCSCVVCTAPAQSKEEIAEMQKLALAVNPDSEDEALPDIITLMKLARARIRELEKKIAK